MINTTTKREESFLTTKVSDRVITVENEQRSTYNFVRRNYLTTTFATLAGRQSNGVYNVAFNTPCCQPCPQPCPQPQAMPMPIYIPMPYPQQCEKECHCEEEEQYKEEVLILRQRVAELLNRQPQVKVEKETVKVENTTRIADLSMEIERLKINLRNEQDRLRQKEGEYLELRSDNSSQSLKDRLAILESQLYNSKLDLEKLQGLLQAKLQELDEWEQRYHHMESTVTVESTETVTLTNEVEVWKSRFKKLNNDFFETQEKLIMAQAELEALKKGGVTEVKSVTVQQNVTSSSVNRVIEQSSRGSRIVDPNLVGKLYP
ncbi:unnamed protein product (macronuclear) [Paramecium tetraurelia]|uniref:Uncharacterized protein n=1 Tax=Paramecium tetraurelia TaxID=5888 RepID=A0D2T3_PARTE|nr:uncharacterized protein GSPATT00012858001 [Paramecium tetraurelia]CAK77350.1 unnamed protein product [Paramecium tetraurelia]|eukprot:XP_001444747.1 hypothetical protein (macronuclear) [Paramecium tetraurelia strain d4-2]